MPPSKKSDNWADHGDRIVVALEAKKMKDESSFHKHLAERFRFPKTYGHNLDALFDCLADIHDWAEKPAEEFLTIVINIDGEGPEELLSGLFSVVVEVNKYGLEENLNFTFAIAYAPD